jgi:hypothetical protein
MVIGGRRLADVGYFRVFVTFFMNMQYKLEVTDGQDIHIYIYIAYFQIFDIIFFSPYGSTAPRGPRPPHFSRLHDHTLDTPHVVGILWISDQPVAETST